MGQRQKTRLDFTLTPKLRREFVAHAEAVGLSLASFIRLAVIEKIARDRRGMKAA